MLDNIVEKVGEENVVQIVTYNASAYKAAGEKLMEKRQHLFWTPCAAHCIDLMLEDFEKHLNVHKTTISKGRKITTYIYSRTLLISMLKEFTNGRDLTRPAVTRFSTAYLTLGCLSELKIKLMTVFSSQTWKRSKFFGMLEGKRVQRIVLDHNFWSNILTLKAALPMIKVLRLVDSDEKPAMPFLYIEMNASKEKIQKNFNHVRKRYQHVLKIIDDRWANQLYKPLHTVAFYLNPKVHYNPNYNMYDMWVTNGLFDCLHKLVKEERERFKIIAQFDTFHHGRGTFSRDGATIMLDIKHSSYWWRTYGDEVPELQKFAIRVLNLTCSSYGCEHNWSAFEMVHTKRRNRLHQKKMNDLVYVMYNMKMVDKQTRNVELPSFDYINSNDDRIMENNAGGGIDEEIDQELREGEDTFASSP